jgi:hypothetical protein
MKTFKDTNNKLHVIDEAFIHLLPNGCLEITQEEADAILAPTPQQVADASSALAKQQADDAQKASTKADAVIQYLINHTTAECSAYVAANVTNLATAVSLLQKMAMALSVLCKKEFQ